MLFVSFSALHGSAWALSNPAIPIRGQTICISLYIAENGRVIAKRHKLTAVISNNLLGQCQQSKSYRFERPRKKRSRTRETPLSRWLLAVKPSIFVKNGEIFCAKQQRTTNFRISLTNKFRISSERKKSNKLERVEIVWSSKQMVLQRAWSEEQSIRLCGIDTQAIDKPLSMQFVALQSFLFFFFFPLLYDGWFSFFFISFRLVWLALGIFFARSSFVCIARMYDTIMHTHTVAVHAVARSRWIIALRW